MILKYKNDITWRIVRRYKQSFRAVLLDNGRSTYSKEDIGRIVYFKDWEFDLTEWTVVFDFDVYLKQAELC